MSCERTKPDVVAMRSTVSPDYDPNYDVKTALKDYKVDFKIQAVESRKM